eukprot:Sdes_comp20761_c0_seq1m16744
MGFLVESKTGYLFSSSIPSPIYLDGNQRVFAQNSTVNIISRTSRFLESLCLGSVENPYNMTQLWGCIYQSPNIYIIEGNVICVENYSDDAGLELAVVVVIPISNFDSKFNESIVITISIALALMILSAFVATFFVSKITGNLALATKQLRGFSTLQLDGCIPVRLVNSPLKEIGRIYSALLLMNSSLLSFSKFVPKDVVRYLVEENQEACLGGERKLITVLFSDIVNFTSMSEMLSLDDLLTIMGEYLEEMSTIIRENEGTVDKFIGDAIMALWNAPEAVENHASKACLAALQCQARLDILSQGNL